MDSQAKIDLIKQVGEEIITEEDLLTLFKENPNPVAYQGFEPSGKIHIAQGIFVANNIRKFQEAGVKYKLLVADWFAYLNNKLGGDMDKIRKAGEYFIEVWKALGVDTDNVEILWSSDVIKDEKYWELVMKIARDSTVARIMRCSQIMGRQEGEIQQASQIFYPCMQAADIFYLDADIAQHGLDQRKVQMLAREIAPKLGFKKPICIHHHMLMGLGQPPKSELTGADKGIAIKMSKSKPDTAIFMTDSEEEIKKKLNKAYCPEGEVDDNPVLEYAKYLIFENFDSLKIERPEKFGGNLEFKSYEELEKAFADKQLHPMDLKQATASYVNEMIQPVREHFEKDPKAKKLKQEIDSFEVTR
ncbi:tyrosine--tRNA ligase [Nanoarchaeota archaeon]